MSDWLRKPLSFGMWLATCLVIGVLFAGGLLLYGQIRSNRVAAIQELCEHDNANAQHNIDFLHRVSPKLMPLAQQVFKQTPDCHTFARGAVDASR